MIPRPHQLFLDSRVLTAPRSGLGGVDAGVRRA